MTDAVASKARRGTPEYVRMVITLIAGLLTIVLTAVAFWLSYEHLHDVADGHGLDGERAWAWPATLDMFIVIGELLILRASFMRKVDVWAWVCTAVGSVGSITLNVVGVGKGAGALDYVIAAVPPVAALLAFGILMRQLHEAITAYMTKVSGPAIIPGARTVPPVGPVTFDGDDDQEEVTEPGLDAMEYRAGDEDAVADNASINYLRGIEYEDNRVQVPTSQEDLQVLLDSVPDYEPSFAAPVNPPSPFVPASPEGRETWRAVSGMSLVRDTVGVLGTRGDIYTAPVGTPEPGTEDTRDDVPVPVSRPVPRSRTTGTGTGVTGRVRAAYETDPKITDDELRDMFTGEGVLPNTINKAIKRVRRDNQVT
jgi:hypothetical protein